jgi:hypothetical protein
MSADVNNFLITDLNAWGLSYGWHSRSPGNGRIIGYTAKHVSGHLISLLDTPQGLITIENVVLDTVGEYPFRIHGKMPRPDDCEVHVRNYQLLNVANGHSGAMSNPDVLPEPELTLFLHDWFGPDQDAKVIPYNQTRDDGLEYKILTPIFAGDVRVATTDVPFPLSPIVLIDRLPPATVILYPAHQQVFPENTREITVIGTCIDASVVSSLTVNGVSAVALADNYTQWQATIPILQLGSYAIQTEAIDEYGNQELNPHRITIGVGSFPVAVDEPGTLFLERTELRPNYPNPFNSHTTIVYTLSTSATVVIRIYDILGRELVSLPQGFQSPGYHTAVWDAKGANSEQLPSGVYLFRMTTEDVSVVNRMILLK